jgi:hypothetical protein
MLRDLTRLLHSASPQSYRNRTLFRQQPGWSRWILELITRSCDTHPGIAKVSRVSSQRLASGEGLTGAGSSSNGLAGGNGVSSSSSAAAAAAGSDNSMYDALLDPAVDGYDAQLAEEVRTQVNVLTSPKYPARARRDAAVRLGELRSVTGAVCMLELMKGEEEELAEEFAIVLLRHFPQFHPHLVVEMALSLLTKLQNEWTAAEEAQLCLETSVSVVDGVCAV